METLTPADQAWWVAHAVVGAGDAAFTIAAMEFFQSHNHTGQTDYSKVVGDLRKTGLLRPALTLGSTPGKTACTYCYSEMRACKSAHELPVCADCRCAQRVSSKASPEDILQACRFHPAVVARLAHPLWRQRHTHRVPGARAAEACRKRFRSTRLRRLYMEASYSSRRAPFRLDPLGGRHTRAHVALVSRYDGQLVPPL